MIAAAGSKCKAQALNVTVRYNLAIPYFIFSRGDRLGQPILTSGLDAGSCGLVKGVQAVYKGLRYACTLQSSFIVPIQSLNSGHWSD